MKLKSGGTLRPRDNLVYVREDKDKEERTATGIIIPAGHGDKQAKFGTVVAVGPGEVLRKGPRKGERMPVCVEPGKCVVFNKYGGSKISVDGEELLVIHEEHVLGAVEE